MSTNDFVAKKELRTLFFIVAFFVIFLVGLKMYDDKTSVLQKMGSRLFDKIVTK